MRLILRGEFSVHILFSCIVEFQFLAQFPVNYFLQQVLPGLALILPYYVAFDYYVINRFISDFT